jgi:hypothetical protein
VAVLLRNGRTDDFVREAPELVFTMPLDGRNQRISLSSLPAHLL